MKIDITIDEATMKVLVVNHLREKLGDIAIDLRNLKIEVKSKQNYKSEWEEAAYRAIFSATVS